MKKNSLLLALVFILALSSKAQLPILASPDGNISVAIRAEKTISYMVSLKGRPITGECLVDMELLDGKKLSANLAVSSVAQKSVNEVIIPGVADKRSRIPDVYNLLAVLFEDGFGIEFRAYNDGVAYRITSRFKDSVTVKSETANFVFIKGSNIIAPLVEKRDDEDIYQQATKCFHRC